MPHLTIRLQRGSDGRDVITIHRPDGSSTWHRLHPSLGTHDLLHFAVERTLGLENGFFGMVAKGWDITAFAEPGASKQLPYEAIWTEHLIGLIGQEEVTGEAMSAAALRAALDEVCRADGHGSLRDITDDELLEVRRLRDEVYATWRRLGPGESMELELPLKE